MWEPAGGKRKETVAASNVGVVSEQILYAGA
jgi:hypothetical protein